MSGISGYGGRDVDLSADEADGTDAATGAATGEAGAATESPGGEAQIQRGSEPRLAPILADMSATQLQQTLEDAGVDSTQAEEQAQAISATAEEIGELESELEMLYDIESMYEDMLNDPETSAWDSAFIEWDLWDVRMDIYDIEDQLGKLQGNFDDLLNEAWGSLEDSMSLGNTIEGGEVLARSTAGRSLMEAGRDDVERARERNKTLGQSHQDRMEDLRQRGLVPPIPPQSDVAKDKLEAVRTMLETSRNYKTREIFQDLRTAVNDIAGGGPSRRNRGIDENPAQVRERAD